MRIVRYGLLVCLGLFLLLRFSPQALAADCWPLSPAQFSFGTVTAGEAAQTNLDLEYQCNNYDPTPKYVRLCMNLTSTDIPEMHTNPPNTPLNYIIYSADDLSTGIGTNSGIYAERNLYLGAGQTNYTFHFNLVAKIPAGQTGLQAGDYYDYGTPATIKYTDSQDINALPSCPAMTGTVISSSFESMGTVKNGCELVSVNPLDFGSKSPAANNQLSADATANVTVRCPVNTTFTVALGMGTNNDGSSRRVCQGASCVNYSLYQDAGHNTPWNDSDSIQTQISATGTDQALTVYGDIPPQNWPVAGTYTDTVVVTLSY